MALADGHLGGRWLVGTRQSSPSKGQAPGWGNEQACQTDPPRSGGTSGRKIGRDSEFTM